MTRFLLKFLLFAATVWVLAACLDRMVCKGLLKMEDYRFQDYSAMLEGGMDHDVLIMGNSRGKSHYDTRIIDSLGGVSSFCIGIGGYPLNIQLMKYALYREHNEKPRVIIQDIDLGTVSQMRDIRHRHQSEQFFPLVYDRKMRSELKQAGYGFCELYLPLYRMYGYQQAIKNGLMECLGLKHYVVWPAYKGHRPESGAWDGNELRKMAPFEVAFNDRDKQLLEDYLAECRRDSVRVILVYSPMYVGAREKISGLDEARRYFDETARKFGCTYLDYLDDPICQDSTRFCVSVHMNPMATALFTRELCHALDSLHVFGSDDRLLP